nr:hypothetical protein [Saprospiraceae bacterium]
MKDFTDYILGFSRIKRETLAEVSSCFRPLRMEKHEYFAPEGICARSIGFLRQGVVRAFFINEDGKEYNKQFFVGPTIVGAYTSLITKKPNKIAQQALTACDLLVADFVELEKLYDRFHDLERLGRKIAEHYFLEKEEKELEMALLQADQRYLIMREKFPQIEAVVPQYHIDKISGIFEIDEPFNALVCASEDDSSRSLSTIAPIPSNKSRSACNSTIKILFVLTDEVVDGNGNPLSYIPGYISNAITDLNVSWGNSGISNSISFVSVGSQLISSINHTSNLPNTNDRMTADLNSWRTDANLVTARANAEADLVVVIYEPLEYPGIQGKAKLYNGNHINGISAVDAAFMADNFITAHEVGHNLAGRHNGSISSVPFPNRGYVKCDFATVMASGRNSRIPYWSNPNINRYVSACPPWKRCCIAGWYPIGLVDQADMVSTLSGSIPCTVAGWGESLAI